MFGCGFNNNSFGINGMMPGGLMPGSTVKISQSRTGGGASIFSKNQPTTTTNITVNNGPTGFWGFASGLMGGLTGNNMGLGGYGMGGYGMGGYGMGGYGGAYVNPQEVSMLGNYMYSSAMDAVNGTGTAGLGGMGTGTGSPALNNLKELAKGIGGTVVDNGNGSFTLQVSGHKGVVNGSFADIQAKIEEYSEQGVKASSSSAASGAASGAGSGSGSGSGGGAASV